MNTVEDFINDERELGLRKIVRLLWKEKGRFRGFHQQVKELESSNDSLTREVARVFCQSAAVEIQCPFCEKRTRGSYVDEGNVPLIDGYPDMLPPPVGRYLCLGCGRDTPVTLVSAEHLAKYAIAFNAMESLDSILDYIPEVDRTSTDYMRQLTFELLFLRQKRERIDVELQAEESEIIRRSLMIEHRLSLIVRAQNVLQSAEVFTVEQLARLTAEDLLALRNSNENVVDDVRKKLAEIGRSLRGESPEFQESLSRFLELGNPATSRELFRFCRDYVHEHPEQKTSVREALTAGTNDLVHGALDLFDHWLERDDNRFYDV